MLAENGLNAEMITQPVNPPDNILLDFFSLAIQCENDEVSKGEGEMIEPVKKTFVEYPRNKINQTWLTMMLYYQQSSWK